MITPTLIDLNPVKLNYYPFMTSLDKCNGTCNAVDDLYTKICVPNKTKGINVQESNMITRINEAKKLLKHVSCDCKCKFNRTTFNSNQKWNNGKRQCEYKKYNACKKGFSWNPSTCVGENIKYLKMILCDETINLTDSVSTSVTSTVSINSDDEKVRYKMDFYIQTISLVIKNLLLLSTMSVKKEYALPY